MGLLKDLKFAIRMLGNSPAFSLVIIITLALGIGVNSTVFTIVNAVLIKGLPFLEPQEIMSIRGTRNPTSYPDYLDYRQQSRSFKGIAAFSNMSADLSDQENAAERVNGAVISSNMFSMLGEKPSVGRDFTPEDDKVGATPVALLSHFLWQSRYGGKPSILGSTIRVNLQTYTVVGVMPEAEEFPQLTRIWLPLIPDETRQKRDQRNLNLVVQIGNRNFAQASAGGNENNRRTACAGLSGYQQRCRRRGWSLRRRSQRRAHPSRTSCHAGRSRFRSSDRMCECGQPPPLPGGQPHS